jgi:hypothetical protein
MAKNLREDIHDIAVSLEKIHQRIKSAADTYQADKEKQPAKIRAELHIPQADMQRNEATQARQERRDRRRLLEAAGLVAVIVYAALTYGQWSQMKKSSKVSERAWGEITSNGLENIKLSDIMTVAFPEQITNAGNTPAKGIRIESVVEIVDRDKPPSFTYSGISHTVTTTSILFPKDKYDFVAIMRRPNNTDAVLTEMERQRLNEGLAYIAVYGAVTYHDGFGPHWTHYCWRTSYGGTAFSANQCIQYNDTDE